jgi:hypothetical protein
MNSWRKSRYSTCYGACVEVGSRSGRSFIEVRDTVNRKGPVLEVPAGAWREFTARVKDGVPA